MRLVTTNELQALHETQLQIFNFNWLTVAEPWSRPRIREPQLFKITFLDNSVQLCSIQFEVKSILSSLNQVQCHFYASCNLKKQSKQIDQLMPTGRKLSPFA